MVRVRVKGLGFRVRVRVRVRVSSSACSIFSDGFPAITFERDKLRPDGLRIGVQRVKLHRDTMYESAQNIGMARTLILAVENSEQQIISACSLFWRRLSPITFFLQLRRR